MVKFGLAERVTQRLCAPALTGRCGMTLSPIRISLPWPRDEVDGQLLPGSGYRTRRCSVIDAAKAVIFALAQTRPEEDVNAPALWLFQPPAVRAQKDQFLGGESPCRKTGAG